MPIVASALTTIHTTSLSLLQLVASCAPKASDLFFPRSTYPIFSSSPSSKVLVELRTSPFSFAVSVSLMSCPLGTLNIWQKSDRFRSRNKEGCPHVLGAHGNWRVASSYYDVGRSTYQRHSALTCEQWRGLGASWSRSWGGPESRLG